MNTGVSVSKTHKRLSTIAAVTGAAAIVLLAVAFVTNDFSGLLQTPSFIVQDTTLSALEPIRSDSASEPDNGDNSGDNGDGNENSGVISEPKDENDDEIKDDTEEYPEHGLPCLDPNCPIHHAESGHKMPCDGPNCPVCNHETPCNDPNCPICNHDVPCDDPNCPICSEYNNKPPVDIPMDIINFKPNSSEYSNKEDAMRAISGYVDSFNMYFNRYPNGKIYLIGCIAKTSSWYLTETELSEQRAEAVRQSLIELGVDGDKLIAVGIGISDPWRNDEWSEGYFNEAVAKTNRRVWIVPDQYDAQMELILSIDEMLDALKENE